MVVQENTVPDNQVGAQDADFVKPLDWRAPVTAHDLLKLDHALSRVDLDRLIALACSIERVADLAFRASVDLRRAEQARDASARMLGSRIGDLDRLAQQPVSRRGIEIILDGMTIQRFPRSGAEHAPEHGADTRLGVFISPGLPRTPEIADGSHATFQ